MNKSKESALWMAWAALFPLFVWTPGYDSFHEPKWLLFLVGWTGLLLIIRAVFSGSLATFKTHLDLPIFACLLATLLAWRGEASDRAVSSMFWLRLLIAFLLFRLLTSWLSQRDEHELSHRVKSILNCCAYGGVGVAVLAILQDWGVGRWSDGPVSDWRFNLSSTLGNPNEVGGYLVYLTPLFLVRWFREEGRSSLVWGIAGIIGLYALTTVFTVGAWMGLFVLLPLSLAGLHAEHTSIRWYRVGIGYLFSAVVFGMLQLLLGEPLGWLAIGLILVALVIPMLTVVWIALSRERKDFRARSLIGIAALVAVWGFLFLPLGIPNHPDGLIQEAKGSPRWQGGFGARRFIWKTTGLMVKDHPIRGIGWGHYYPLHSLYQGEVYRQLDTPFDRPMTGLVPQVHSDPLQIIAEAGVAGGICFFWLAIAAFRLGYRSIRNLGSNPLASEVWACWAGLGLIGFHCLVDFPLRQPQPCLLALVYLSVLVAPGLRKVPRHSSSGFMRVGMVVTGMALLALSFVGLRDEGRLKEGFEARNPERSAEVLDSIRYPLPETHDRWIYRARAAFALGDTEGAKQALLEAGKYRHSLSLYHAWNGYGQAVRDPAISLAAVRGLIRHNPGWWGFHEEAAKLLRLVGEEEEAEVEDAEAKRLWMPEKPLP